MRPLKDIVEKSQHVKIDERYCLRAGDMRALYDAYRDRPWDLMCACFDIGYLQGAKAEKRKLKDKEAKGCRA